ncbi:MAG: hypothetical protein K2I14_01795 [Eubacterium sp.]|nr:hypothetical protein [Eubacterium sp.]
MIIFIGSEEHGFFLNEIFNEEISYTGTIELNDLTVHANSTASSCIIIDVTQWSETSEVITKEICSVAMLTRSKIIIYAVGFANNSILCNSLRICGIHNIITAGNLSDIKTEFMDFYTNNDNKILESSFVQNEPSDTKNSMAITIAVAGSQNRIGTTVQCFQIAKYLTAKGFKAAYLEFNKTNYLHQLKKLFNLSEDDFSFEGINMYSAKEVNRILQEYDYIVYDYGSITDKSFNQYSFLEKSKCIIVCGATPSEIDYSTAALGLFQNNDNIIYLFNFVPKADETDIAALMGNHQVLFSPLIPDMFTVLLDQQKLYDSIIDQNTAPIVSKREKKGFFSFRRNK